MSLASWQVDISEYLKHLVNQKPIQLDWLPFEQLKRDMEQPPLADALKKAGLLSEKQNLHKLSSQVNGSPPDRFQVELPKPVLSLPTLNLADFHQLNSSGGGQPPFPPHPPHQVSPKKDRVEAERILIEKTWSLAAAEDAVRNENSSRRNDAVRVLMECGWTFDEIAIAFGYTKNPPQPDLLQVPPTNPTPSAPASARGRLQLKMPSNKLYC